MHCCPDQTSSCIWWHHTLAHSHSPGTWAQLLMVCAKCEKKLAKVACPDKWKEGSSNTIESGGRKINENKLLSKSKRWVADQWPGPGQWRLRDPCSSMNTWLTSGSGHAAAAAACTGQQQPGAVAGHRGGGCFWHEEGPWQEAGFRREQAMQHHAADGLCMCPWFGNSSQPHAVCWSGPLLWCEPHQ